MAAGQGWALQFSITFVTGYFLSAQNRSKREYFICGKARIWNKIYTPVYAFTKESKCWFSSWKDKLASLEAMSDHKFCLHIELAFRHSTSQHIWMPPDCYHCLWPPPASVNQSLGHSLSDSLYCHWLLSLEDHALYSKCLGGPTFQ